MLIVVYGFRPRVIEKVEEEHMSMHEFEDVLSNQKTR